MIKERIWMPVKANNVVFFDQLSRCFEKHEKKHPNCFPDLRRCSDIVIASDYSGEHKEIGFSAFSFLLFDWDASEQWSIMSSSVRNRFLSQGKREMAYKKLRDQNKQRALLPFLEAADQIKGMVITLLVSKRVKSVIEPGGHAHLQKIVPALAGWKSSTIEKLYRVQTLLVFLLAGLCDPHQRIYWLTDDDEIVANPDRLMIAAKMLPCFSNLLFAHNLNLGSVDTVNSMNARIVETAKDITAIPDLVGGALVDAWSATAKNGSTRKVGNFVSEPKEIPKKAKIIMKWFRQDNKPLRRLVAAIDISESNPTLLDFRWLGIR